MKKCKRLILIMAVTLSIGIPGNASLAEGNTECVSEDEAYNSICAYLTQSGYDLQTVADYNGYIITEAAENDDYVFLFKSYTGAYERFYINMYSGEVYASQENPIINEYEEKSYAYNVFDYIEKAENTVETEATTEKTSYECSNEEIEANGYIITKTSDGVINVTKDGEERTVSQNDNYNYSSRMVRNGEALYYAGEKGIYCYDLSSNSEELVVESKNTYISRYRKGYIFYEVDNYPDTELKRYKVSNGETEKLGDGISLICLVDKTIIYGGSVNDLSFSELGTMNLDGSEKSMIAENVATFSAQYEDGNIYFLKLESSDPKSSKYDFTYYTYKISSDELTSIITFTSSVADLKISKDGQYIYGYDEDDNYYKIEVLTGEKSGASVEEYEGIRFWE